MNDDTEQLARKVLRDWSDQAPHDPDLLSAVLTRASSMGSHATGRRSIVRRLGVPALAAGLTAAVVTVGVGLTMLNDPRRQNVETVPAVTASLSPEEVEALTRLGVHGRDWDDAKVQQAWKQKWGVPDIGTVTDALRAAARNHPHADGGLTYFPDTLTYTQWILNDDVPTAATLRIAVQEAFDDAAGGGNLALDFATATTSDDAAQALLGQLTTAYRTDPAWPEGLALTGEWSPSRGRFVLPAGSRSGDLAVQAYFERRWPRLVLLTPAAPPTPQ